MLVTFCFPILVFLLSLKLSSTPQKTALQFHLQISLKKKSQHKYFYLNFPLISSFSSFLILVTDDNH